MELFNEDIIPKRTLGEIVSLDNVITNQSIVNGSFNGGTITIGSKENVFKVDRNGIYLGASSFSVAPFRVDMQGNMVASSATIAGDIVSDNYVAGVSGYKLEYSTGNGYFNQLKVRGGSNSYFISDTIDTSSKYILKDFSFSPNDYSGAFKTGNITWNSATGDITGGSGGVFNKKGLIFANNGNPTIVLDGTTGKITSFALDAGTITGVTITGGTIQTASSGQRVVISGGDNTLAFYNSNNLPTVSLANTDGTAVYILSDSISSTGIAISSTSSGNGIYCSNTANVAYRGIYVEQTNTGASNINPCIELQHDGRYYAQLIETTNQSGGILCQTSGTGKSVVINNSGNETCLEINETSGSTNSASSNVRISSNSAGSAIAISKGAVSGNVTGIKMSLSGGLPAAFEFTGSELVVGAVGGLQTRKVRVRIGTDFYYIPLYTE